MALEDGNLLDNASIAQLRQDHDLLMSITRSSAGRRQVLYPPQSIPGVGTGSSKIWFTVLEVSQYMFTTPGCEFVRALVTQVSCGSSVQVGDEVLVFDPHFCWFNIPIVVLMQFSGTATLAVRGTFDLTVCGVTVPDCFWAVDSACCLEEVYG